MAARGASVARATCSVAEWSEQSASRRELVSVGRSVCPAASGDLDNGGRVVVMRE